MKNIIFILIITAIAIFSGLILEVFIDVLPLIYFTISLSLLFIGYAIINSAFIKKHEKVIVPLTNILFAFFMLMTFFTAYQTYKTTHKNYEINIEANKPQLTVQLTTKDLAWGHFVEDYEYKVWYNKLNDSSFHLPIYLVINNYGSVPTQIYNIQFKTKCGNNGGLLSIPQNQSSLIKPGKFFELSDDIYINVENGTIKNILPCKVNFGIYGPNFNAIYKTITLIEQK